jgi:glycerol-3-phosphate dehydrogenase
MRADRPQPARAGHAQARHRQPGRHPPDHAPGHGSLPRGFCIYRATGILHAVGRLDGSEAAASLRGFLQERWKGVWPILYGDQLRQARLDDWIFQGLLDVEHLPDGEQAA